MCLTAATQRIPSRLFYRCFTVRAEQGRDATAILGSARCTTANLSRTPPPSVNATTRFPQTQLYCLALLLSFVSQQLTFTTSSSKKRRVTRQSTREQGQEGSTDAALDVVLATEQEAEFDPAYPFDHHRSTSTSVSACNTPAYSRGDSLPPSGIPPHLQNQFNTLSGSATDYVSADSAASSPCAASADLSVDNDRDSGQLFDSSSTLQAASCGTLTSQPPFINTSHRALMGGASEQTHRSGSPLKRRASSMDPEYENADSREDVEMLPVPDAQPQDQQSGQDVEEPQPVEADAAARGTKVPIADMELPLKTEIPPIEQQIKTIETLLKAFNDRGAKEGDVAYLVSRQWLNKAQAFGANGKPTSKEPSGEIIGPIDNSDIIQAIFTDSADQQCVKLKPGVGSESAELFPKDAWDLVLSWYGLAPGQAPIVRIAHNTALDAASEPNVQFEFHPPVFTVHRLWSAASPLPIEQEIKLKKPPPPVIVQSASASFHQFLKQIKKLTGVPMDRKVRVWQRLQTIPATEEASKPSGMETPPDSPGRSSSIPNFLPRAPGSWPEMLVDVETFSQLERGVERDHLAAEDTTTNPNYNGRKSLSLVGLTVDQTLIIDEQVDRDDYVSTFFTKMANGNKTVGNGIVAQARGTVSGRNSPAPPSVLNRGRVQPRSGRTPGCVGLQNLGNTCYMNSALQCLRSVEELTKYFLTHEAKKEINPDNPLSHNGDVAMAYMRLLDEIYKNPPPNSVAPRHFKGIVGRYAPAFSGYGQQDSQEFLGFLLDGLQEDLNRIKKKPYIEKPDSTDDMIGNPAAIKEMAEKVWDITKKRDDSIIADLFTGLYKSTLHCPVCDKISITFDPFNNLTLPLPMSNVWSRTVKYYPLNEPPVEIVVEVDKTSAFKAIKEFISTRVGVPPERLVGGEEFKGKFFKQYDDMMAINEEIQPGDIAVIHEVEAPPTNVNAKKAKKQVYRSLLDDAEEEPAQPTSNPLAERLLVPVLHRTMDPNGAGVRYHRKVEDIPPPHYIVLTPQEACDENIIRRKILQKVATLSTWSEFTADEEASEATDPEMVNGASDIDSADSKVVAKSVESEEDIVDVTMGNTGSAKPTASPAPQTLPALIKRFKSQQPKWLDPSVFLNPALQNLFAMSYFRESHGGVPTGWQSVNDTSKHERLSSRAPKTDSSDVEMRSPNALDGSDDSGSEEASSEQVDSVTRMADESSEGSDAPKGSDRFIASPPRGANAGPRGKNKKMKAGRTYSKKAKKRFEKEQLRKRAAAAQQPIEVPEQDYRVDSEEGPLVRLGEGIVVDWYEDAFDAVFSPANRTYNKIETLNDPSLGAKKRQRELRKKHGISLDDCLAEFEKEEILSEQDTWYCPRCKEHRRASKKFDLWKTPDILVVHLKRFSSVGWRRDKLDVLVDFPIEGLDLTERVIDKEDGKQEIYDLIAVDDHWGGLGGGHYTAFAKNFVDDQWYEFNDSSVSKVTDTSKVVSPAAYLLFYRRRSDKPLGGPKCEEVAQRYSLDDNEEMLDSGEGQRLGHGSSLRGSPSASNGAGQTLLRGEVGSVSGRGPSGDSELPSYQETNGTITGPEVRKSIEFEDEGIDLPNYEAAGNMSGVASALPTTWSFDNIPKTGSEASGLDDEIASDVAQGDNSGDDASVFAGINEYGSAVDFIGPAAQDDDYSAFTDNVPPPPSVQDQDTMDQIAQMTWEHREQVHEVFVNGGVDIDDDKVAEIHVDDHEQQRQSPAVREPPKEPEGGDKSSD
ncbi:hypothetical protein QR685DRAFT_569187 [Neurospora intermedia]|uniref:ubiquitinyl hydrolase 1 n=1 Tax=Neurospora intermedia TaxID=5142 RepID=A0ABR3DMC8_NEUIN